MFLHASSKLVQCTAHSQACLGSSPSCLGQAALPPALPPSLIITHPQVLFNNAGVCVESLEQRVADLSPAAFQETLAVNALGPLLVVKELQKQVCAGKCCHA